MACARRSPAVTKLSAFHLDFGAAITVTLSRLPWRPASAAQRKWFTSRRPSSTMGTPEWCGRPTSSQRWPCCVKRLMSASAGESERDQCCACAWAARRTIPGWLWLNSSEEVLAAAQSRGWMPVLMGFDTPARCWAVHFGRKFWSRRACESMLLEHRPWHLLKRPWCFMRNPSSRRMGLEGAMLNLAKALYWRSGRYKRKPYLWLVWVAPVKALLRQNLNEAAEPPLKDKYRATVTRGFNVLAWLVRSVCLWWHSVINLVLGGRGIFVASLSLPVTSSGKQWQLNEAASRGPKHCYELRWSRAGCIIFWRWQFALLFGVKSNQPLRLHANAGNDKPLLNKHFLRDTNT